jgi:hypothetical protein
MADNEEIMPSRIGKQLKINYLTVFLFVIPALKPYIG